LKLVIDLTLDQRLFNDRLINCKPEREGDQIFCLCDQMQVPLQIFDQNRSPQQRENHMNNSDSRENPEQIDAGLNLSFLLRVWSESSLEESRPLTWRYSLKDLTTRAQRGFANLDGLLAYLENMESEPPSLKELSQTEGE
jgi:hypothetical protein